MSTGEGNPGRNAENAQNQYDTENQSGNQGIAVEMI